MYSPVQCIKIVYSSGQCIKIGYNSGQWCFRIGSAPKSIGDGGVHNGGGVLCNCGIYNGSNRSLFGETFCGPA